MTGKILAAAILLCAVFAGAAMYYLQVYAFYDAVEQEDVVLTRNVNSELVAIEINDFQGIDANSSPIRYRACFTTPISVTDLLQDYQSYSGAVPRTAPGWFECFDAPAIGAAIEAGTATVFTGQRNVEYGIDRVVAITQDGRGYVWHEVNDCGDKLYDGSPKGSDCPPRPEGQN